MEGKGAISRRWRLLVLLGATAFLVEPLAAEGAPVINLDWSGSGCRGPFNLVTVEGSDPSLNGWVQGQEEGHQGYELSIEWFAADGTEVPDAWRFDKPGCQAETPLEITNLNPVTTSQGCGPGLSEPRPFTRTIDLSYDIVTRRSTLAMAVSYPQGIPSPNPYRKYIAVRMIFSVAATSRYGISSEPGVCGGYERPVCFRVGIARYQNLAGEWVPWTRGTPASAHGPEIEAPNCDAVPAAATNWGRIKAQYR
jgi:hypothetical protein